MTALHAVTAAAGEEAPPSGAAARVLSPGRELPGGQAALLLEKIDPAFLAEAGWNPETRVLTIDPAHPLLGRSTCRAPGCQTTCPASTGICLDCRRRLEAAGLGPEDAGLLPPPRGSRWLGAGDGTCTVPGCPRPWTSAPRPLCPVHLTEQQRLGIGDPAVFAASPGVTALPSHGICAVAACPRQVPWAGGTYCEAHRLRLRSLTRAGEQPDEGAWQRTEPPVPRSGQVSLAGLAPAVVTEILFGLQQRTRQGVKTHDSILRAVCDDARSQQAASIADLVIPARRGKTCESVVHTLVTHARRAASGPETEIAKDTWDMALFGQRGMLPFAGITQPWLRETAKIWAAADLPRRRGRAGGDKTRHYIASLALLSQSLRQRPDRGEDPAVLGRPDIEAFLARLAWQHSGGQISELTRVLACRETRKLLTAARQLGAAGPGGPAAGLSDQFTVRRDDTPDEPEHGEPGRDLPAVIIRQVCGHLPSLAAHHIRTASEILIDTGRRPEDVVALPLDCLSADAGGSPVLVYDNLKASRLGRRLPVPESTARSVREQQKRVRAQFPATPVSELKLLPTGRANRDGRRPITVSGLSAAHREWVSSLPPLLLEDGTEYDKDRVIPYAYRHSYAQRHADAGVPIDVLAELMDHRSLNITRRYYRVGEERRRDAVDKVTAMQFDRHGNRVWRDARALLDDEHARYAVGSVAVPYGTCTEPSNVAAGGTDCPLRFRCAGCDHYRTDVSYLPDLTAYLDDLLRTRERLAAAGGADDWARAAAAPPDQEIRKVRELIRRVKGDIAGLEPGERARIDDAVAVVRRHRAVSLGMPRLRQPASRQEGTRT
ncbi:MAG TPA: tyrosine-type recombinase/integrase [Trebonia sp.]